MANTVIALRSSGVVGNVPNPLSLEFGEFALNYADGIIYYRSSDDSLGSVRTTEPAGLNKELQFNDSGSFGSSANLSFNKSTNVLTTKTVEANTVNVGNLNVTSNTDLGNVANVKITGGLAGQFIISDGSGGLSFGSINDIGTITYTANSVSLTNGVYISGDVTSIQTYGDTGSGGYYNFTDGTVSGPAWIFTTDFINVVDFNRIVMNINYTQNSGHTIYVQMYNYNSSAWDNFGTYTGLTGYYQFALEALSSAPYISGGVAQVRLYHSNTGNALHETRIDYIALQLSSQGAQGPRGATGSTGATGATGAGVASGGTTGQILVKNSSTNYDTSWSNTISDNITFSGNVSVLGNVTTSSIVSTGGASVTGNIIISTFVNAANIISRGNVTVGSYIDMNTVPSKPAYNEGRVFYDNEQKALAYYNESSMTGQILQESVIRVWNNTGSTIVDGKAVYVTGTSSSNGFPSIALANSAIYETSEVIGITTTVIPHTGYGYVTTMGKVNGIDTHLLTEGEELYLSATDPGGWTTTAPATPAAPVRLGVVTNSDVYDGSILVDVTFREGANKTTGSILFAFDGTIHEDTENFFYDHTNHRLGIGTNTPSANLHVEGDALFTGNVHIDGNLYVTNAQSISTSELIVGGNTIIINELVTGSPTSDATIVVNRGSEANAVIRWNETSNEWTIDEADGRGAGHILSHLKTANSWAVYSAMQSYEKEYYPIGANLANNINEFAKISFNQANTSLDIAKSSFDQANLAFNAANSAVTTGQANVGAAKIISVALAQSAYDRANAAYELANTKTYTYFQNTTPVSANSRDIWINTDTGYVYENFGNNTTTIWAEFGPSSAGGGSLDQTARDVANSAFAQANLAFDAANTAVTSGQANVGAGLITVTSAYQANVGAGLITVTSAYQANVGAGLISAKSVSEANVGAGLISAKSVSEANVGSGLITATSSITNAYQANVGSGLITAKSTWESNAGAGLISAKSVSEANVGAGLISYQATSQANVGAGLISTKAAYEANVGAGLITAKSTWEANAGAGDITITNAWQANTGVLTISKVNKSGDVMTGALTTSGLLTGSSLVANTGVTINTSGYITSTSYTTGAATTQVTVDSFATATYRSAKYEVQMTAGTAYHVIELRVVHDGTTVSLAQYGEIFTGSSLGTFDASIATGTLSLLFTPASATVTTVKLIRRNLVV